MDISPEYITLCNAAFKFRKLWKPVVGDFYFCRDNGKKCVMVITSPKQDRVNKVWLPRADQLFAMAEERYNVKGKPAYAVNRFHQYLLAYSPYYAGSVEQMLLQFVMHEVFGLRYFGGRWQAELPKDPL